MDFAILTLKESEAKLNLSQLYIFFSLDQKSDQK